MLANTHWIIRQPPCDYFVHCMSVVVNRKLERLKASSARTYGLEANNQARMTLRLSLASVVHLMLGLIQRQPLGTSSSESSQMLSVAHGLQLPLVAQKNPKKPKLQTQLMVSMLTPTLRAM